MSRAANRMAGRVSRTIAYRPARHTKRVQALTLLVVMTLGIAIAIGAGVLIAH
jgi:ABC-type lipoprotein release transport system permease subunit